MSVVEPSTLESGANPFSDPLRFERRVPECAIVIFGASGDLTKRKLLPALFRLAYDRRLPARFSIIGTSRRPLADDVFRDQMRDAVQQFSEDSPFDPAAWDRFAPNVHYIAGDIGDPELYTGIKGALERLGQANVLFYLATQPSYYGEIVDYLGAAGMGSAAGNTWRRVSSKSRLATTWPAPAR